MDYFKNNSGDFVDASGGVVTDPATRLQISQSIGGELNKLPLYSGGQTQQTTITPTRNLGESISDFTNRIDTGSNPSNSDYAFSSEGDFYSKTGLKDMSTVKEFTPGSTPTSDLYKYAGSPTVYQKSKTANTGSTPVVGTSDTDRAKARAAEIARIKTELDAGNSAPALYKSADEFQKLRTEQGVVQDEQELAAIRNEAAQAKEQLNQFKQTSSDGVAEDSYLGGISEAERNMNFRLDSLSLREQAVVDRLNSKNSYISTMVGLGAQDYQTANAAYTNEYNKNVKAIEMYNTEIDNNQKDALTAFTTITNLMKDQGVGEMTPAINQQLDTLALKAGLPSGLFQSVIKSLGNEKILSPVTMDNGDGSKSVYFYTQSPDGTPHLKSVQNVGTPGSDDKVQQKLEQQYRTLLSKELSNRSGGLGLQDAKVNQAIHLKALLDQYKDAKGNYNVPASQYAELAMGLAALVSGTNAVSDSARDAITQRTLAGDLKGAVTYITGTPISGSTQDVIKNLADSIDRQGNVAEDLRDQYVKLIQGQAPTDLEQSRIDKLNGASMPSYRNYGKSGQENTDQNGSAIQAPLNNKLWTYPERPNGYIWVKDKSGQQGLLPENEFDASQYNKITFNSVGKTLASSSMRTDRMNNPTAFTTAIARLAGLKEGIDYTVGDPFSNGQYHTAKLIGDPVATTIKVIDKIGFKTASGNSRWTYTDSIPGTKNWDNLNYDQKKAVIYQMYQHEGGTQLKSMLA